MEVSVHKINVVFTHLFVVFFFLQKVRELIITNYRYSHVFFVKDKRVNGCAFVLF